MRRLISFSTLAVILGAIPVTAQFGGTVVVTPNSDKISIAQHIEEIEKIVALISEITKLKDQLGDAKEITIKGSREMIDQLNRLSVERSRVDVARNTKPHLGVTFDDGGLYQAPGRTFTTRDGKIVSRGESYGPEAALFGAIQNHDEVYMVAMERREALRGSIQQTAAQIQAATTLAEVQKATGLLLAQQGELAAIDRDMDRAVQRVMLLELQNRADRERQVKAGAEEQAAEAREALLNFGQIVRPPTFRDKAQTPKE